MDRDVERQVCGEGKKGGCSSAVEGNSKLQGRMRMNDEKP